MRNFVTFLDFDGVLHPKMTGSFEYLKNFYLILDRFKNIKFVVSSDWRLQMSFKDIESIFGPYYARFMGCTPHISNAKRETEILQFVCQRNVGNFIAVDDDCRNELFSEDCTWLFKTDYYRGLDAETTEQLIKFIDSRIIMLEE